jgi:hypothetical protein
MVRITRILGVAIVALLCGQASSSELLRVRSQYGNFDAEFPNKPTFVDQTFSKGSIYHTWSIETDNESWSVGLIKFLFGTADISQYPFDAQSIATKIGGTLVSVREVASSGHKGHETVIETMDNDKVAVQVTRYFAFGRATYSISYTGPRGSENRPEVRRFLSSIKLF